MIQRPLCEGDNSSHQIYMSFCFKTDGSVLTFSQFLLGSIVLPALALLIPDLLPEVKRHYRIFLALLCIKISILQLIIFSQYADL